MEQNDKSIYHLDDDAIDYFSIYTAMLEREMAYWMSPEQIVHEAGWLAQVLAVVELMLLFHEHDERSSVFLEWKAPAERWREVFLQVWDNDWGHEPDLHNRKYPFSTPEQRQQERAMAVAMFDYLHTIGGFWAQVGTNGSNRELPPMQFPHPLPYFSARSYTRIIHELFGRLQREIIYWLSREKHSEIVGLRPVDVWVSIDVLGFLSERYERTPGVNATTVQAWREKTLDLWKEFHEGDAYDENDLLAAIMGVFDHLARMAEKYPPMEW
jgi:hypothetical protein